MHANHGGSTWPIQVPIGTFRVWDMQGGAWSDIEYDAGVFDYSEFDERMTTLKQDSGVDETLYTLSRTPWWAFPDAGYYQDAGGQVVCDYAGTTDAGGITLYYGVNSCLPPPDLTSDGSGTDLIWITWVTALANHVNAPGYANTHAHIHIYEPWNEFYRSDSLTGVGEGVPGGYAWPTVSYQGSYAQLVRMTEDLRCVVKGVGVIHNSPTAGSTMTCAQLLAQRHQSAGIDPTALISTPSAEVHAPASAEPENILQQFLYCNGAQSTYGPAAVPCSTGDAGSEAVDVINLHNYPANALPETFSALIADAKSLLSPADLQKPFISGEGSWGDEGLWFQAQSVDAGDVPADGAVDVTDPYTQAGFIPRYLALGWSSGLSEMYWYAYDSNWGGLFTHLDGGSLEVQQATAWATSYGWLLGATGTQATFCNSGNGTLYACDFRSDAGRPSRLVWDSKFLPDGGGCRQYADPWVCGDELFDAGAFQHVSDLSGTERPVDGGLILIGANPVLLQ